MGITKSSIQGLLNFYKVGEGWQDLRGAYNTKSMTLQGGRRQRLKNMMFKRGCTQNIAFLTASRVVQKPVRMA